jgi:ribose-phosphate pyrophosphokinase
MELVGDVRGKKVLLIDDIIDTGGSLIKATDLLLNNGASEVSACITHGVLSGNAYDKIITSNIKKLYISDTIPNKILNNKIEIISCSSTIAKVINAINEKNSVEYSLNKE